MEEVLFWLSLALKIFTVYFACIALFALKRRRRYPKAAPATRFAVVVAARNEEAVIGNLVESILDQNYPAHLRDVYVVPNNCTDYTAAAATAAGARILHCLGLCMLLWPLAKRLPNWGLAVAAVALLALGYWFRTLTVQVPFLFPLGLTAPGFTSSDYFPLLPNLGWFLLGALTGRTLYRRKQSLFPRVPSGAAGIRFLSWCGRQSLLIYLLHQPVLFGLFSLYLWLQ